MSNFTKNVLLSFGDINGDFERLIILFTNVFKIATYDKESNSWTWIASNTTVVCSGNFVKDCKQYTKNNANGFIDDQIKIIQCFESLAPQAKSKFNSNLIILIGNNEFGYLLGIKNYFPDEETVNVQHLVDEFLYPLCNQMSGVIVQWGNYFVSHGSIEYKWISTHNFTSITQINKMWKRLLQKGDTMSLLRIFGSLYSPIHSKKIAKRPNFWRQEDKPFIIDRFGYLPFPKFIVSRIKTSELIQRTVNVSKPDCKGAKNGEILSSIGTNGARDIYYINVGTNLKTPATGLKIELLTDSSFNPVTSFCFVLTA
jgi:hypothetical protein